MRRPRPIGDIAQPATVVEAAAESAPPAVGAGVTSTGPTLETTGNGTARASGAGRGQPDGAGLGDGFDTRAFCTFCPEPGYPLVARARGWQGTVEVALSVRADGTVNGVSLGRSSGYPALDDAALAVARLSRFHLPDASGLERPLRGRMEYRFVLR